MIWTWPNCRSRIRNNSFDSWGRDFNFTSLSSSTRLSLNSLNKWDLSRSNVEGLSIDSLPTDKVSRVQWYNDNDTLRFNFTLKKLISKKASVNIDLQPLWAHGLASPVFISAKKFFQECCRWKIDWDERIPDDLYLFERCCVTVSAH